VEAEDDELTPHPAGGQEQAPARSEPGYPDIYSMLPSESTEIAESFPMHGVHRDDVLRLVRLGGGLPFLVEDEERGGPEWRSFRYFVSKPPASKP
jgi:hypothetical protein